MDMPNAKFNTKEHSGFYKDLSKRVNDYFKKNNLSKKANFSIKIKGFLVFFLYISPFSLMLFGVVSSPIIVLIMWAIMAMGMLGIGFGIMHDANHGAYSKSRAVNKFLGRSFNLLGSFDITWRVQHNVLHHTYPNVHDLDEDMTNEVMRFSPTVDQKKRYRFQEYFGLFLYGLLTLHRLITKDFEQLFRYHKQSLLAGQGYTFGRAFSELILSKILYLSFTIGLLVYFTDIPIWTILLGFFIMHYIAGMAVAVVFQVAHVVNETEFYVPDSEGNLENNWAIHQLKTSIDFAHKSTLLTWFLGGLNYQVEHHLFPTVSHTHLPKISEIVKETTKEYGIPYLYHKTFYGAIESHFSHIKKMGTFNNKIELG
ncbi:MAG: fatty acid desaturase family protein, partial [Flavobacteriales bacterium]